MRVARAGSGAARWQPRNRSAKQKPRRRAAVRDRRRSTALRLATLVFVHVVGDAEAGAGGGVHLLGRVDRVLKLGDAVLDLGQLLFDLILQIADLLLGDLKRGLVKLPLLIAEDRHSLLPKMRRSGADYSLKLMVTGIHDFTRTPSFVPAENPDRRTACTAASVSRGSPRMTRTSCTAPLSDTSTLMSTAPSTRWMRATGGYVAAACRVMRGGLRPSVPAGMRSPSRARTTCGSAGCGAGATGCGTGC